MELYLDSVDIIEIEEALHLGFLHGLTTTPTFMHKQGIDHIDALILRLSKMVPVLQVESLGEKAEDIIHEAHRLIDLGLDKQRTVFKIPVSIEGVKACHHLRSEGLMVNIHLVYTLQQAYLAMAAGANYICPLVGRLQDQGHDALALVEQCVNAVNYYGYNSKIMFSSVRHPEHVRNAINLGVHACTIPWKVMKMLAENNFTTLGTEQFIAHSKLMTMRVKEVIRNSNPFIYLNDTVLNAIVQMTESGFGAVAVLDEKEEIMGVFTDGDLRRNLKNEGKSILNKKMSEFTFKIPVSIEGDALLHDAATLFKEKKVDNILVTHNGMLAGMLDIQDLAKHNLLF